VTEWNQKTTEELVAITPATRYTLNPQYETAEVLRSIYNRNTKCIPKGMVMHG
jgi:hypothetical protein